MVPHDKALYMRLTRSFGAFENLTYPITTDELVDRIGETELELQNGKETIKEVFDRLSPETYINPSEAHLTFLSALSTKAIGRKAYSDRDPPLFGIGDVDPRAVDPLLDDDTRFDVDGPHCGICQHMNRVGDWDAIAYCTLHNDIVEPQVDDVCSNYVTLGWDYSTTSSWR